MSLDESTQASGLTIRPQQVSTEPLSVVVKSHAPCTRYLKGSGESSSESRSVVIRYTLCKTVCVHQEMREGWFTIDNTVDPIHLDVHQPERIANERLERCTWEMIIWWRSGLLINFSG